MAIGVEPCHLVLVLVGKQLRVVDRHRARQLIAKPGIERRVANLRHQLAVAPAEFFVLVLPQERAAVGYDLVERHRIERLRRNRLVLALHQCVEPSGIGRRQTPKLERLRIHFYRNPVDTNRLLDRARRQRQQALLIGIAHHHHVGGNGVAEQGFGRFGEIEERRILAQRRFQHVVDVAALEVEVPVEDEISRRDQMAVDDAIGAAGFAQRDGLLRGSHHFVGGDHEIGGAGHDARTGDIGRILGQPHVAQHRAAFLRQSGHVQDHAGLALDMRGHAKQRAYRQHAGTSYSTDGDVVGSIQ